MGVAWIGGLERIMAGAHLQQEANDVLERHIEYVRSVPAAPTNVIARTVLRNVTQRVIERVNAHLRPVQVLRIRRRRYHALVHIGQESIVDLHVKTSINNGPVFLVQGFGEREQVRLLVLVMLDLGTGQRTRRRHYRQEAGKSGVLLLGNGEASRDVLDVAA